MKVNMEGFKKIFGPKTKTENIEVKDTLPLPEELDRKNFPEGIEGEIKRSIAARNIDKDSYFDVVPQELEDIIKKADDNYYVVDKLQTLLSLLQEEKWTSFNQIDIEKLNSRLRGCKTAGEINKIEEDNPLLKYYSKTD